MYYIDNLYFKYLLKSASIHNFSYELPNYPIGMLADFYALVSFRQDSDSYYGKKITKVNNESELV